MMLILDDKSLGSIDELAEKPKSISPTLPVSEPEATIEIETKDVSETDNVYTDSNQELDDNAPKSDDVAKSEVTKISNETVEVKINDNIDSNVITESHEQET